MNVVTIALVSLRRLARDRIALFFIVLLPVVVILVIGAVMRGQNGFRVAVVAGEGRFAVELTQSLAAAGTLVTSPFTDESAARDALRRNEVDAVLLIPAGMDETLTAGAPVELPLLTTADSSAGQGAWSAVASVVAHQAATVQAATFAASRTSASFDELLPLARALDPAVPQVAVRAETVGSTGDVLPPGFSYSAPTMLVFFVFINALAGGAALIQTRRLGIHARILAGPVRPREVMLGETLCYLALTLLQSGLIIGVGGLLFGVDWGDPLAAVTLTFMWGLVGAGAGMLSGALFRTPEQASAIGPAVGIGAGMLGGCTWPLEIVPPAVRAAGHVTPHAWAVDAWTTILSRGGGIVDILGPLAVLGAFAALFLGAATFRLRRSLTA
ncbi:ABC transporter permease [Amycolatopsis sp. WAC 04182]|uniref:ABC transporter permease n=1 Tax=Amycolatopsis sp. WAC 04182 TaxID=2203198 RepID=UPI000F7B4E13|nr:ABC transporter permease [Amycolatopsis sp. WAC 04182]RSN60906.1 ABC transporter permease [Amycolatopsis sp. WAC 04182]